MEPSSGIDIGAKIKLRRKLLGVTQSELALLSSTTQMHIASIESGKMIPRSDTLERILYPLGLRLAILDMRTNEEA